MGKKLILKQKAAKKKAAQKQTTRTQKLDIGIAEKSHLIKKAKTHKGRKQLEKKAP